MPALKHPASHKNITKTKENPFKNAINNNRNKIIVFNCNQFITYWE
jgi:hypothetical protein